MSFLIFPMVNLFVDKKDKKAISRKIITKTFRFFINMMSYFGMFNFNIEQAEASLADYHGKVIVANHPSLIDVVVLIAILPHADCVVKKSLWNNPFLKGVVKAAGYIKNDEDPESLIMSCQKSLDEGFSLIIFPEGTRTQPEQAIKLQRGASNIALRCGADIVPVIIRCKPSTLTKNEPWYSIPDTKAEFSVKVNEPIKVEPFVNSDVGLSVSARRLTEVLKNYLSEETKSYA
ncbi:lysophospholipid acyltransferase family protein [Aliikangiella sp. IMCC44359]|uniref:lysophospholipid acyltransferase family protein n=1 Tax=Aliikangiella sp. IMCC44359 TaxID=3459125 RepID=UPI00403B20BC